MDENVKNMRDIPLYPYSGAYARFAGELDQYRESRKANQECGKAIDAVFDAAWDGTRLPPEAGTALIERFGPERLGYVLADTIQQRSGDIRFSTKNREWARNYPMLVSTETRWEMGPKSHSAKLDGLITQLRPELEQVPELAARAETLKNIPLYQNSMQYAQDHGEGAQYAASHEANIACKEAVEAAIASNHDGYVLKDDGAKNVAERFGYERTFFVLASTIRHFDWDQRISRDNIEWAKSQPSFEDKVTTGRDFTQDFVVHSQPGLTNLFLNQVREQYALEQERTAAQRQAEPENLLTEDDASMIDGILNNGAKDNGPPKAEQSKDGGDKAAREEQPPEKKRSIRKRLTEKPPEQEKPAAPPRKREVSL